MMMDLVVFGDVEDALRVYLSAALGAMGEASPVFVTVPTPRPSEFTVVRRIGGRRVNQVTDSAQLSVECFAATEGRALGLIQLVRAHLVAARGLKPSGVLIHRVVEYAGPALLPDPESDHSRYVLTLDVEHRGESI